MEQRAVKSIKIPRLAYSIGETADKLSMCQRSVWYLVRSGRLRFCRIGRRFLIPHSEIERLLRKTFQKPLSEFDCDEPIRVPTKRSATNMYPDLTIKVL